MKKKSIKQIGFIVVTSLTLSACGGGSNSNDNQASSSTTNTSVNNRPLAKVSLMTILDVDIYLKINAYH